jgi:hypothetical protein
MPVVIHRGDEDDEPREEHPLVDLAFTLKKKRASTTAKKVQLLEEATMEMRRSEEELRDFKLHRDLSRGKLPRGKKFREEWR